jgi:hypothetical protein
MSAVFSILSKVNIFHENQRMDKSMLKDQVLSIQAALKTSEMIHAEVMFKNLKLLDDTTGIPKTCADLTDITQLTVKYRS